MNHFLVQALGPSDSMLIAGAAFCLRPSAGTPPGARRTSGQ